MTYASIWLFLRRQHRIQGFQVLAQAFGRALLLLLQFVQHQDIIKYSFDIIFNLLNYHQIQAKQIAYKIYQANCCIKIINYLQRNCLSSNVVQSGIDALQKQFILQAIRKQALENGLLKCMQDIANTQSWNENILQKYIKVLFSLIKQNSNINTYILKSQICAKLANFIKQHPQINQQYLDLLVTLSDVIYQKGVYENANDIIFTESVFGTTGGIFQKSAVPLNCMTIIGIAGQQLSIRQLDVEFASQSIRDEFAQNFKYLVSMEYRNHRSYG